MTQSTLLPMRVMSNLFSVCRREYRGAMVWRAWLGVGVIFTLALFFSGGDSSYYLRLPTGSTVESAISGVSGSMWRAVKVREFKGRRVLSPANRRYAPEVPPVVTPEVVDAWWSEGESLPAAPPPEAAFKGGCESNKWVVITSIFAPSVLIHELKDLEGWCTVVVADKKTPVNPWLAVAPRVKLLTVEEQGELHYHISPHLPWNHFGRKNLGFLYAMHRGAHFIYDTDDDNILKRHPVTGRAFIPHVSSRGHGDASSMVAQAWHCAHDPPTSPRRTWNPYVLFGAVTSWPRGMPLDDIIPSQSGCEVKGEGEGMASTDPTGTATAASPYNPLFQPLPGIRFAVQQSLADIHPDIDGIHRLTRSPLTFSFLNSTRFHGLYAPDGVFAPYNAQATLHEYSAFWSLLLPITVHGRVSDIWRSYIAQRLMWRYGLRVAFMRPFVDQDRTPHNYLKDFQAEVPLYLRAGGLVDFLSTWTPSSPDLPLPAEYEELLIALYEVGVVEEADVLVAQAWLMDLMDVGYRFPTLKEGLYDVWKSGSVGGGDSSSRETFLGTAVGVVTEKDGEEVAIALAKSWAAMVPPTKSTRGTRISAVMFHVEGGSGSGGSSSGGSGVGASGGQRMPSPPTRWEEIVGLGGKVGGMAGGVDGRQRWWWSKGVERSIRAAAPGISWEFHPVVLSTPVPDNQGCLFPHPTTGGGGGGSSVAQDRDTFVSIFHTFGLHRHPAIAKAPFVWLLPPHTHSTTLHSSPGWESSLYTCFTSMGGQAASGNAREVVTMGESRVGEGEEEQRAFTDFCGSVARVLKGGGLGGGQGGSGLCSTRMDLLGAPGGVAMAEKLIATHPPSLTYNEFIIAMGWREGIGQRGWKWTWLLNIWLEFVNAKGLTETRRE